MKAIEKEIFIKYLTAVSASQVFGDTAEYSADIFKSMLSEEEKVSPTYTLFLLKVHSPESAEQHCLEILLGFSKEQAGEDRFYDAASELILSLDNKAKQAWDNYNLIASALSGCIS